MQRIVTGQITAADIGVMGNTRYGYLGIETDEHEHMKVKVTAFTKYDTLAVGAKVTVELESGGSDEDLPVVKRIISI